MWNTQEVIDDQDFAIKTSKMGGYYFKTILAYVEYRQIHSLIHPDQRYCEFNATI